jgi:hypothetical protein
MKLARVDVISSVQFSSVQIQVKLLKSQRNLPMENRLIKFHFIEFVVISAFKATAHPIINQ